MRQNLKLELKVLSTSEKNICFPVIFFLLLRLMCPFGGMEIFFVSDQNVVSGRWVDRSPLVSAASPPGTVRYPVQSRALVGHFY